jgi:hypothetical protein
LNEGQNFLISVSRSAHYGRFASCRSFWGMN